MTTCRKKVAGLWYMPAIFIFFASWSIGVYFLLCSLLVVLWWSCNGKYEKLWLLIVGCWSYWCEKISYRRLSALDLSTRFIPRTMEGNYFRRLMPENPAYPLMGVLGWQIRLDLILRVIAGRMLFHFSKFHGWKSRHFANRKPGHSLLDRCVTFFGLSFCWRSSLSIS